MRVTPAPVAATPAAAPADIPVAPAGIPAAGVPTAPPDGIPTATPTGRTGDESAIERMLREARRTLPGRPAAADLPALRGRGALIVDTRPLGLRLRDGEMAGAVVVDRNQLEWRLDPTSPYRIPEVIGPDQEIVLVCDEGYASSLAAATLQRLGLRRATDLEGGFQAVLAQAALALERTGATGTDPRPVPPEQIGN